MVNEGTIALDSSTELATSGNVANAGAVSLTNGSYSYVGGWADPASGQFVTPGRCWDNRGLQSTLSASGSDVSVYGMMTNAGVITADGGAFAYFQAGILNNGGLTVSGVGTTVQTDDAVNNTGTIQILFLGIADRRGRPRLD